MIDRWRRVKPFIEKMNNVELVMMDRRDIKSMGWQAWKKRTRFYHPKDFLTLEIQKIAKDKQRQFSSIWQTLGNSPKFSEMFQYQDISFWPILKQVFDYLIERQGQDMICEIESIKSLLNHFSINRVVLRTTSKDHFYITTKLAQQLGIPSIELQHGLIHSKRAFMYFSPVRVDYFASYGRLTKEILIRHHSDPKRIVEVGSPRFDYYLTQKNDQRNIEALRTRLGIDPSRPVVLLTIPPIGIPRKPREFTGYDVVKIFKTIVRLQSEISGIQILFKLRPSKSKAEFYKEVAMDIFKGNIIFAQYEDMKSLLSLSDVLVSSPSTLVLEAMIVGKPVILYPIQEEVAQFQLFEEAGAIRIAKDFNELISHTRSLILDKKSQEKLVKNATTFLQKYYQFDGKASERIIEFLNKGKI